MKTLKVAGMTNFIFSKELVNSTHADSCRNEVHKDIGKNIQRESESLKQGNSSKYNSRSEGLFLKDSEREKGNDCD
jgi:hypothetical protein